MFDSLPAALTWGEFDATVVMVPHHLHEPMASQCLVEGKHVLLEKPLAHTVEACVRLLEVSEQSDRVFMVGENSQFWPEVTYLHNNFGLVSGPFSPPPPFFVKLMQKSV